MNAGSRRRELLPTPYVHVVFTLPPQLAALALQNRKLIYGLLLRASAETLLEVARNRAHLGAEIGFFSVLHTWNQKLQLHPHVHCVVPAGGLSRDHSRWIRSHPRFFLPIAVLRRVFRGKFVAGLKSAFQRGQLHLAGELASLNHPKFFAVWLRSLFRKDWIVYSKPPFGGPEYVLQYLGRYTHRVAISTQDSRQHNSSSVPRLARPRLHEIIRPYRAVAASECFAEVCLGCAQNPFFLSSPRLTLAIDSSLHRYAGCDSSGLDHSRELLQTSLALFNLHKSRVRRASGFLLTAFSNATRHTFI